MCISEETEASIEEYFNWDVAHADMEAWEELYRRRTVGEKINIPKAFDANFAEPANAIEKRIAGYIKQWQIDEAARLETELFELRKRLADAERTLQTKTTKKALEDQRIAGSKIKANLRRLETLKRTEIKREDRRIWPFWYGPVVVVEQGRRILKPMRYHCRENGKPAAYDRKFPGIYNARRDSLEGYWRTLFGRRHAFIVAHAFYENVARHRMEGRELKSGEEKENVLLRFDPRGGGPMLLACLWDRWEKAGEPALESFAAITDEPPPEVSAAGHDRCVIPLRAENLDAWLSPENKAKTELYAILDDRERPYYEHLMAA